MDCPVCLEKMENMELFGIPVDSCRFCGGVWLDGGELNTFIQKGSLPGRVLSGYGLDDSRRKVQEGERHCPHCGNKFDVIPHKGVNVDFCSRCRGMWFDRSELKTIMVNYHKEVESKGKKKLSYKNPTIQKPKSPELEGEEIIRITDTAFMELDEEPAKTTAVVETLTPEELEEEEKSTNVIEQEMLAGLTKEHAAKALPRKFAEKKEEIPLSTPLSGQMMNTDFSMGGGGLGRSRHGGLEFGLSSYNTRDVGSGLISFITSLFG